MIIRLASDEEKKRADEVFYISFEFPKPDEKPISENKTDKKSIVWAAFEDDNKTMMSSLIQIPYEVNFDGTACAMAGIGGVSTLPHYRKAGGTKGCLNSAIKHMYENDFAFSYLYPFSTRYYNKFGYANCCESIKYTINLQSIIPYDIGGTYHLIEENSNFIDDIATIYKNFAKNYNMMVVGGAKNDWITKANPAKTANYAYLYKNAQGIPKGIMEFKKLATNNHFNIECSKFFFSDKEGLKGLLNHTQAFSNYYENISFALPSNMDIVPFIKEWALHGSQRELLFLGMVRVINVEKVLKTAKYIGTGDLSVKITDPLIPQNNATFQLAYNNAVLQNIKIVDTPADMELDIDSFSQLICGVYETAQIPLCTNAIINTNIDKLSGVFYKKNRNICEYF